MQHTRRVLLEHNIWTYNAIIIYIYIYIQLQYIHLYTSIHQCSTYIYIHLYINVPHWLSVYLLLGALASFGHISNDQVTLYIQVTQY